MVTKPVDNITTGTMENQTSLGTRCNGSAMISALNNQITCETERENLFRRKRFIVEALLVYPDDTVEKVCGVTHCTMTFTELWPDMYLTLDYLLQV